jgi:hypothetical protein
MSLRPGKLGCSGGRDLIVTEKKMEHKEVRVDEDELEAMHAKLMEKRVKGWAGSRRISCSQVAHTTDTY